MTRTERRKNKFFFSPYLTEEQSVSKWERGESYPDITFLPALANIFETSVDLLIGMDTIRAEETRFNIHKKAVGYQRSGDYDMAEKTYRDALLIYPNKPGLTQESIS